MNAERLKGNWNQLKGEAKIKWGKLTDDQLDEIDGNFDKLVGMIQKEYGKGQEEAEQEAKSWSAFQS